MRVGDADGIEDGACVGMDDGEIVGDDVGCNVGATEHPAHVNAHPARTTGLSQSAANNVQSNASTSPSHEGGVRVVVVAVTVVVTVVLVVVVRFAINSLMMSSLTGTWDAQDPHMFGQPI